MELSGKKICFLGDSITEGCGTSGAENGFPQLLYRQYGLAAAWNHGIGGTRFARQIQPSENPITDRDFCARVSELNEEADVVVVFGGTNDYGHGDAPFGTPLDRTADTFCGACYELFSRLRERFPAAVILVVTPIHRLRDESHQGDGRQQAPRPALREYVQVIRETARAFGLPVLDLFQANVLNPNDPAVQEAFVPDGLHPNDDGHRVLAQWIGQCLETL